MVIETERPTPTADVSSEKRNATLASAVLVCVVELLGLGLSVLVPIGVIALIEGERSVAIPSLVAGGVLGVVLGLVLVGMRAWGTG